MTSGGALGRTYQDGEVVVRQGEEGDCLYVVQEGQLEVVREEDGKETFIRLAGKDELLGEMAIFERQRRSATVRAKGPARVLTLDKKNFLRRVNEDPSLAFRIVETMSRRVRELSAQVVDLKRKLGEKVGGTP
jgi:CRP/FNR family transcriptional regulator, cyclic AMP receptor protein